MLKVFKHVKTGLRLMLLELALMLTNVPLELTTVMKTQHASIGRFKISVYRYVNPLNRIDPDGVFLSGISNIDSRQIKFRVHTVTLHHSS